MAAPFPPSPNPPRRADRREHLPTVRAAMRYWSAVLDSAQGNDRLRARTARSLLQVYRGAPRRIEAGDGNTPEGAAAAAAPEAVAL